MHIMQLLLHCTKGAGRCHQGSLHISGCFSQYCTLTMLPQASSAGCPSRSPVCGILPAKKRAGAVGARLELPYGRRMPPLCAAAGATATARLAHQQPRRPAKKPGACVCRAFCPGNVSHAQEPGKCCAALNLGLAHCFAKSGFCKTGGTANGTHSP